MSEFQKPPINHKRKHSCETVSSDDIRKSITPMSAGKDKVFTFDNKS